MESIRQVAQQFTTQAQGGDMTKKTTPKPATTLAAIDYNALADAIAERIVPALMVAARLAAADTVRTAERTETVLRRAIEGGYEILESPMPALLTVIDCNMPRPVNVKRLMKNKRAKTSSEIRAAYKDDPAAADAEIARLAAKGLLIEEWSAKDIEADPERIGFAGSPTKVKQVQSVILTAGDAKSVEPTADGIAQLMHELISDHTLG
jgi:electron transfer flavoprotein beta subunit